MASHVFLHAVLHDPDARADLCVPGNPQNQVTGGALGLGGGRAGHGRGLMRLLLKIPPRAGGILQKTDRVWLVPLFRVVQ